MRTRLTPLFALAALTALGAQTTPTQQPPTFRAEANFVRVDMYATEKGVPVEDLTQADVDRHYQCDDCADAAEGWGP